MFINFQAKYLLKIVKFSEKSAFIINVENNIFSNRYSMNLKNVNINYLVYFTTQLQKVSRDQRN